MMRSIVHERHESDVAGAVSYQTGLKSSFTQKRKEQQVKLTAIRRNCVWNYQNKRLYKQLGDFFVLFVDSSFLWVAHDFS